MTLRLYPPTPFGPRVSDAHGAGHFGAPRGSRKHNGVDWITQPWGPVVAPMAGHLVRIAKPYRNSKSDINTGLLLENHSMGREAGMSLSPEWALKMFYCSPLADVMDTWVEARQVIAMARPMREEYAGISPHVHLQLYRNDRIVDPTPYITGETPK